jgi:hypothetical protein
MAHTLLRRPLPLYYMPLALMGLTGAALSSVPAQAQHPSPPQNRATGHQRPQFQLTYGPWRPSTHPALFERYIWVTPGPNEAADKTGHAPFRVDLALAPQSFRRNTAARPVAPSLSWLSHTRGIRIRPLDESAAKTPEDATAIQYFRYTPGRDTTRQLNAYLITVTMSSAAQKPTNAVRPNAASNAAKARQRTR